MNLKRRSTQPEKMDTDCVDFEDYSRCLRDLTRVNVFTLTHQPMLRWLGRQAKPEDFSVLEVACGQGDALRKIRRRWPKARLTGLDLNPWAIRAAREATPPGARIDFIEGDAFAFRPAQKPDFIISSQFTHHLTDARIVEFLAWQQRNAARGWFISDVHRHWLAHYGFPVLARAMMWHRLVREDGQVSIARAFRPREWRAYLQEAQVEADIRWHVPFRLCVSSR